MAARRKRCVVALLLGTLLALSTSSLLGINYWPNIVSSGYELQAVDNTEVDVLVTGDAKASELTAYSLAKIALSSGKTVAVRIYWQTDQEPMLSGQSARATISAKPLTERNAYLAMSGLSATASLSDIQDIHFAGDTFGAISARRAANSELIAQTNSAGAALVQGMVLGDTRALDGTDTAHNFKVTGLMHLVAVSGSHLAVIAALLGWALERTSCRRWLKTAILVLLLALYVVLTGFQPSAIRSAIMASVGAVSFVTGRRRHTPSLLCAAALLMLALDPSNTFDVGFWLSVFAVLGISMFYPLASSLLMFKKDFAEAAGIRKHEHSAAKTAKKFVEIYIAQPTALTVVAQAATLPLSAAFFGMFSVISPLANLLAAPFATVIVAGGIFALTINQFSDPLALILLELLSAIADLMNTLVAWLASLPLVATPFYAELSLAIVAVVILGAAVYAFWRHITKRLCCCLLAAALAFALVGAAWAPATIAPQLVVMDVGQGDALLVREGANTLLVDTGPSDSALIKALARQGVQHLDAVVLTHLDADHVGALDALYGTVSTDRVYLADGLLQATRAATVKEQAQKLTGNMGAQTLQHGDRIQIGKTLSALVVWPVEPALNGENEESVCLLLQYDYEGDGIVEFQSLLMGDAERVELEQIAAGDKLADVDIIKVGHHGSTDAVGSEQLLALNTKIALISAGRNNRFGHPTTATLSELEQAQAQALRTDLLGDISISFNRNQLDVRYHGQ
jgi:competence protein ComEC